jgi:hypothetical protein
MNINPVPAKRKSGGKSSRGAGQRPGGAKQAAGKRFSAKLFMNIPQGLKPPLDFAGVAARVKPPHHDDLSLFPTNKTCSWGPLSPGTAEIRALKRNKKGNRR